MRTSLRPLLYAWIGALIGAALFGALGFWIVGDDLDRGYHITRYHSGAQGFVNVCIFIGLAGGFILTRRILTGRHHTRSGYTLSYAPIAPRAVGYRELETLTVADLLRPLR